MSEPLDDRSAVSAAQQEYLAEAYRLYHYHPESEYITTSALADRMHVSAPAVAAIVKKLQETGFVEHEPYRGMKLTDKGKYEALMNIRRHRLSEIFLVKVMGFGWHEVHDEADAIGGVISNAIADRMEVMAGYPKRCPHGEPIPTRDGRMPDIHDVPLSEMPAPAALEISRVNSHDPDILKYLATLNLVPGTRFTLTARAPFNGPLRLSLQGNEQIIGYELAQSIRVALVEQKEKA